MRYKYSLYFFIAALLLSSCAEKEYKFPIRLDEIPLGQINNLYGSPQKNKSFTGNPINISGKTYEYGLGTHAPSDLRIVLDRQHVLFEAVIGIDANDKIITDSSEQTVLLPGYVYDCNDNKNYCNGGTSVFKVFADDRLIYESPVLSRESKPLKIKLKIKDTEILRLTTDPADDGSFHDFTNWAMAKLRFREDMHPSSFFVYSYPGEIMYNQSGYKPGSYKHCVIPSVIIDSLYVFCNQTDQLVYKCTIDLIAGDMGKYITADFSALKEPGYYYLYSAGLKSKPFEIDEDILKNQIRMHLEYLKSLRNCGNISTDNFISARRDDKDIIQQTGNSWFHSFESGLSSATAVQLLYALSVVKERNYAGLTDSLSEQEILAGNRFLRSMLEPEGYLMHSVHLSDSSKNNSPGSGIDFSIHTKPAPVSAQFLYSLTLAKLSGIQGTGTSESKVYLTTAEKCFQWTCSGFSDFTPWELGTAIGSACELYKRTNKTYYKLAADNYLNILLSQIKYKQDASDEQTHFIFNPYTDPSKEIFPSVWTIAGLCFYINTFREDKLTEYCMDLLYKYSRNNILFPSYRNAFHLVPDNLHHEKAVGIRGTDDLYYSLFHQKPTGGFPGKGNNSHIASTAAVLIMIDEILNMPELSEIAQMQLDWVLGCNPFRFSFINGLGFSHPASFHDPVLLNPENSVSGRVMAGISSDTNDSPAVFPGWKQTTGDCIESLANVLWLTVLLDK